MADQTQLYHSGSLTDGWRLFGAHPATEGDVHGWWFNVWAPHAKAVSVVGDFNGWDLTVDPLTQKGEFWQGFLPDLPVYTSYKYAITGEDGRVHYKADPYGFHTETRPGTAEVTANVPLANMFGYATDLRSKTQGRANYSMEPSHYAELPKNLAQEIIGKRGK